MPTRELPPLSPEQVVAVQDALLANADQLLTAATNLLESNVPLARSLAILALEESGKAIALHDRRVAIAYATEGEPFVTADLQELWSSHDKKLSLVHQFLAEERYWFGEEPSDPEENSQALGAIRAWSRRQDRAKQRGFYVDLDKVGNVLDPAATTDEHALRIVIAQVHQIGWQLRLGEHIEAKRQAEEERGVAPAESDEIESFRTLLARSSRVESDLIERMLTSMQEATPGRPLNNSPYRIRLPSNSFDHLGRRGYEAETRELHLLSKELDAENASDEHPPI